MSTAELLVDCRCELGEGPFWNSIVGRLFWFDIINQTLYSARPDGHIVDRFTFDEPVSAGAALDAGRLAIVSASGIYRFSMAQDTAERVIAIEADREGNRSNDCRLHPSGSWWIGTMSRRGGADPGAGAIYWYRDGQIETIIANVTIPNAICFSPDGRTGYFTDTETGMIRCAPLDHETGKPVGPWRDFASTEGHRGKPDGAVVDSEGYLWSARWGGGCVVRHAPDGTIDRVVDVPASNVTCPAFGGEDLRTLYVTTAREGLSPDELEKQPHAGSIFALKVDVPGQTDPIPRL
ncbi:MAG: SMP-30/gluconolactonase/LRE family protein [Devosia sp.]